MRSTDVLTRYRTRSSPTASSAELALRLILGCCPGELATGERSPSLYWAEVEWTTMGGGGPRPSAGKRELDEEIADGVCTGDGKLGA